MYMYLCKWQTVHMATCQQQVLVLQGLTSGAAGSILEVLQAHPTLQQLLLSRNALTDVGVSGLCAGPWKGLKLLELVDCGLTAQVGQRKLWCACASDTTTAVEC